MALPAKVGDRNKLRPQARCRSRWAFKQSVLPAAEETRPEGSEEYEVETRRLPRPLFVGSEFCRGEPVFPTDPSLKTSHLEPQVPDSFTTSQKAKMAEPPVKRARRTDSSTMWDMNDKRRHSSEPDSDYERPSRREPPARDDGPRNGVRDDRRYRSRSRERAERRRERSRSRDRRDRDRDRDGRRDRDKDRDRRGARDRERSTSRDRYYDRRGMYNFLHAYVARPYLTV